MDEYINQTNLPLVQNQKNLHKFRNWKINKIKSMIIIFLEKTKFKEDIYKSIEDINMKLDKTTKIW